MLQLPIMLTLKKTNPRLLLIQMQRGNRELIQNLFRLALGRKRAKERAGRARRGTVRRDQVLGQAKFRKG
jgi:hypothetical protein